MVAVNYLLLAILAIAFMVLGFGFLLLITRNMRQGRVVRQHLAKRVETLRMSRMLQSLGIDFNKYLHTEPVSKINESMNKCDVCVTTDTCDARLDKSDIALDNIEFCPNKDSLNEYAQRVKSESGGS